MEKRRDVLKKFGATLGTALVVGGPAAAKGGRGILYTFDPSDPEEVRQAALELVSLDSRERAESVLRKLSAEQVEALKADLPNLFHVETESVDSSSYFDGEVSTAANSKTHTTTGYILNQAGGVEAYHEHHVYWEYDGTNVTHVSHYEVAEAPGWVWYYRGNTTDYLDNRGDYAVSKMAGLFEQCLTTYGCVRSETIGSTINMFGNGSASGSHW